MKKKVWISIGVVAIIAILVGVNVWRGVSADGATVEVTRLKEQEMAENIMIPGTLKLKNEQTVYVSPEKGEVQEITVKEGDKVKKGDVLLRYTNESLQLEKEQNALNIELGYMRINSVKNRLDRLDKKERDLAEQVGEEEASTQIEEERDQLKTEERSANIELKQSILQKESIEKQLRELKETSDVDGTVLEVDKEAVHASGSLGPQGELQPVIRIAALDELMVEGVISEYDTLKVEEGQPVTLRSDVVPDEAWEGTVTHIGFLPRESAADLGGETEAVQYAIEVAVESEDVGLKPGFQLIMEIETEKKTVPTLPLEAIVSQDSTTIDVGLDTGSTEETKDEENIVFVVKDGKVEARPVKVGTISENRVEILDGLDADEEVVAQPPDHLKDGMDVTVQ